MYRTIGNREEGMRVRYVALMAVLALVAALACGILGGCSSGGSSDADDAATADTEATEAAAEAGDAAETSGDATDVAVPGGGEGLDAAGDGSGADAGSVEGSADDLAGMLESDEESRGSMSTADLQTIGSRAVGYMAVPSTWIDRTDDMDPNIVDAYEMVYYVDPDSEYTSSALSHFAFSKAVQLTVQPTSYRDIAAGIVQAYEEKDMMGEVSQGEITIGGRDAILIVTSIPEDNQLMCTIVIDRDGDGHAALAIASNCGASTREAEEVLGYLATWQPA